MTARKSRIEETADGLFVASCPHCDWTEARTSMERAERSVAQHDAEQHPKEA